MPQTTAVLQLCDTTGNAIDATLVICYWKRVTTLKARQRQLRAIAVTTFGTLVTTRDTSNGCEVLNAEGQLIARIAVED